MKRITSFLIIIYLAFMATTVYADYYPSSKGDITSRDNDYIYSVLDETGEACFQGTNIKSITVLNIPEIIDGKKVVGVFSSKVDSNCLVRVNYSNTIKTFYHLSMPSTVSYNPLIPICRIDFGNSLKTIRSFAMEAYLHNISLKILYLPKSIEVIEHDALYRDITENIIIQGNPKIERHALTVVTDGFSDDETAPENIPCNIYYCGDASNTNSLAFNYDTKFWDDINAIGKSDLPSPNVVIYKKPGAKDFSKFYDEEFEDTLRKANDNYAYYGAEPPHGYTVKEYTDEWWKDIKEIQSVEISGEGVTLKKDSKGKGTITELGWSPSNDPAQYLSREYELSANPGDKIKLASSFAPSDAFDDRTFFVSLNEDIATVDTETGEVTVLKEGTATIRCVAASGVFSDCFIYSGLAAQTQAQTQAKSDSLKAKAPLIIISCSCAAVIAAGVVIFTVKKKRRKV